MTMIDQKERDKCLRLLRESGCSCVVSNGKSRWIGWERGVKDLMCLLKTGSRQMQGSFVADKVVGKAAASLMILGGIAELHAGVLSLPAWWLLQQHRIPCKAGILVPHIVNRAGNAWCPLEERCFFAESPEVCLQRIESFLSI